MKSKLATAFSIIAIFIFCVFIEGCKTQISGVVESEATNSLPFNFGSSLSIAEPRVEELPPLTETDVILHPQNSNISDTAAVPVVTPSPTPTASRSIPTPTVSVIPNQIGGEVSIPVLNYHSIGITQGNTLVLDPKKLTRQMEFLAEQGYSPLTLSDFILLLEKKKSAPAKPVLLTFDDGYVDNYEQAMPILKLHGFPATIFISPGTIGQEGKLNWQQVKEMHEAGWDIQPHGMTHPHLPELTAAQQKEEIMQSRRQIEEQLGTKADIFCYPYGEFNKQTLTILNDEGFRYAFTIRQGRTTSSQDPFHLKRIYVNSEDSLLQWSKKL